MKKLILLAGFLFSVFSSTLSVACNKPNCTCGAESRTKMAQVTRNIDLVRSHQRKEELISLDSEKKVEKSLIHYLPVETLSVICRDLDGKSALALSESYCGLWNIVVESRGHLVFKPDTPIEVVEEKTQSIPLKSIILSTYDKELKQRIPLQCISDRLFVSLSRCPRLVELHFSVQDNLTEEALISIGKITSLKKLFMSSGALLRNLNTFSQLVSLQHLDIRNMRGPSDISGIKDLPELTDVLGWNLDELNYDHIQSVIEYRKTKGLPVEKRTERKTPGPGYWGWQFD